MFRTGSQLPRRIHKTLLPLKPRASWRHSDNTYASVRMRAHPPMPLHVSRQACLAAPPSPAHRSPMHAAVSALHGFSQRGAATAEDATTATASAATKGSRLGPQSLHREAFTERGFLVARHPPRCLA